MCDVEGEAIDDVADDAATEEEFDVLNVAEHCLERLPLLVAFWACVMTSPLKCCCWLTKHLKQHRIGSDDDGSLFPHGTSF